MPAGRPAGDAGHGAILGQAARLLLAPWQWRRNGQAAWLFVLSSAVVPLSLSSMALVAWKWMPPQAAWVAIAVLALTLLVLFWGQQIAALWLLDHPHAAHAVPGHQRALRATAVGLWGALVLLGGLAAGLATALRGGDGLHTSLHTGLAAALAVATALLLVAVATRWWWAWLPLWAAGTLAVAGPWQQAVRTPWGWALQIWQGQPLALSVVLLGLQALVLGGLFGRGDARHAHGYARRAHWRRLSAASVAGQKPTLAAYGRWGERLGRPWQHLTDAWLARVCRQASARPASVMARADIVLHGVQHWVRQLATLVLVQALLALIVTATLFWAPVDPVAFITHGQIGITIGLTSMAMGAVISLPGALWQSRREQSLLMLLPGMPQGVALNRAVAWRQLRHCLWTWLALLPLAAAMVWAGMGQAVAAFSLWVLPMAAWMWRDPARLQAPRPSAGLLPVLLCLLGGALVTWMLRWQPGLLLPWVLLVVLGSLGLLAWRWRGLARRPQALPAGRLA